MLKSFSECLKCLLFYCLSQSSINSSGVISKSSRMIFLIKPFGKSLLPWIGTVVTLPSGCFNLVCEPLVLSSKTNKTVYSFVFALFIFDT